MKPDMLADCLLMSAITDAFTSVDLSTWSLLLSSSLAHDAGICYSEAPFHFLDDATGASDQL